MLEMMNANEQRNRKEKGKKKKEKRKSIGEKEVVKVSVLFTLLYFTLLYMLCKTPRGDQGGCRASPRDDAGQFPSNQIGPKKRLAYETDTERALSGWPTLENAP